MTLEGHLSALEQAGFDWTISSSGRRDRPVVIVLHRKRKVAAMADRHGPVMPAVMIEAATLDVAIADCRDLVEAIFGARLPS